MVIICKILFKCIFKKIEKKTIIKKDILTKFIKYIIKK